MNKKKILIIFMYIIDMVIAKYITIFLLMGTEISKGKVILLFNPQKLTDVFSFTTFIKILTFKTWPEHGPNMVLT